MGAYKRSILSDGFLTNTDVVSVTECVSASVVSDAEVIGVSVTSVSVLTEAVIPVSLKSSVSTERQCR